MRVLNAAQMRALDAASVAKLGEIALMRAAGDAIATVIPRYARPGPLVAFAGGGNNGGDAFSALAAADLNMARTVYGDASEADSPARKDAIARARASGVRIEPFPTDPAHIETICRKAGLVIDGLLGVNARVPLGGDMAAIVAAIVRSGARVLACDIPTGVDPSTGAVDGPAIKAVATITFGAPKLGLYLDPGRGHAGHAYLARIDMDDADIPPGEPVFSSLDDAEFCELLPVRASTADKRSAGAPLIIAGSEQFPGAAILCARGAARAGAGYVTVATTKAAAPALRLHLIEQVIVTYDERDPDTAIETLLDLGNHCSSIGIGPGLGLSDGMGKIVRGVIERTPLPIVADASALFHLSKHLDILRSKNIVITPHAREFARLSGKGTVEECDRVARLRDFVDAHGVTTLLKGRTTLIAQSEATHINPTGSAVLATAGTGDVLTGIIATLLAQGLTPLDAARIGAYWHGRAGHLAHDTRPYGVIAGDLPDMLAAAATSADHRLAGDRIERLF
jgi:hydroxyethylthiazole kinase-like uncharacterized protein yjeF